MRLAELIQTAGKKVYARYEALASEHLAQLRSAASPDPRAIAALADRYPLARCAAEARLAAAEAFAARGDTSAAMAQLHHGYRTASKDQPHDLALLGRIVGRLVSLYEQDDQPRRAKSWLRTAMRDFPELRPIRNGQPTGMMQWLAMLDQHAVTVEHLPELDLPLRPPYTVRGRLLIPSTQREREEVRDHILTLDGQSIQYRGGERLEVIWEYGAHDESVELLSLTDDQAVLWLATRGQLVVLDVHTGRPAWPVMSARSLLRSAAEPADPRARARAAAELRVIDAQRRLLLLQQPVGAAVNGSRNRPIIRLNDRVICLVDRSSREAVGVDRYRGEVLWRQKLDRIHNLFFVDLVDQTFVLGGLVEDKNGPSNGTRIAVLDAGSGEARTDDIEDESMLLWLGLTDSETLLYITRSHMTAVSLGNRRTKWRQAMDDMDFVGVVSQNDHQVLLRARSGSVIAVDLDSGRVHPPVAVTNLALNERLLARAAEGVWHLATDQQAMALNRAGGVVWRDAVFDPDKNLLIQLVGKRYVVLVGRGAELQPGDTNLYHVYLLNRVTGVIVDEYTLGPLSQPVPPYAAMFLDNRIVLGTDHATIVIPDTTVAD